MKSLTVWRGHSTRPSLPAGTAKKGKENLPRGRRNRLISPAKKNRAFPMGNALLYISLSYVDFCRVRPGGRTLFLFCLQSSNPWLPAAFHRRMQVVFSKKQTSPKPVFVRQDFGEAVKKKKMKDRK